jgi:hypothetical protein
MIQTSQAVMSSSHSKKRLGELDSMSIRQLKREIQVNGEEWGEGEGEVG